MNIFELTGRMSIEGMGKVTGELDKVKNRTEQVQKGLKIMGAAFTAVGAAGLALVASSKKMNAQLGVTALNLGISTKEMRDLALATTNVTFPLDEVTASFDLLARAGIKDTQVLKDTATAFDTLGDAVGMSASQVTAKMVPAMKTYGLSAEEVADKTDLMTNLVRNTTVSLDNFGSVIGYVTPELVDMGLTLDDTVALMAIMESKGMSGEVATRAFRTAITQATREQIPLQEALGITSDEMDTYKSSLEGIEGMTEKYAEAANKQYGVMDKLKQKWSELTLQYGTFLQPLEPILATMTALGPVMLLFSTVVLPKLTFATAAHTIAQIAQNIALAALHPILTAKLIMLKLVTAAQWLWNIALSANPIGIVVMAIGALIAAGIALWKNWDKVQLFFKKLWANMKIVFGEAVKFIVNTVLLPFIEMISKEIGAVAWAIGKLVSIFNKDLGEAIENFADRMFHAREEITAWADNLIESSEVSKTALAKVGEAAKETGEVAEEAFTKTGKATEEVVEKVRELADEYEDYIASIEKLIEGERFAETEAGKLGLSMEDLKKYMIAAGKEAELLALSYEDWLEIGDDVNRFAKRFGLNLEDIARISELTTDSMLRDIRDLTGEVRDAARERTRVEIDAIDDQMDAHRDAHQERMNALQDEYNATIKTIDAELDYALKGYEGQLDAIDRQIEAIDDAERGRRDTERKAELEASIAEEDDAEKRIDLEDRLNELLIESDNHQWQKERELAYEARIAEEKDADEHRRLEQRLADFLIEIQARRNRQQLEDERVTLRQQMDMAREEARNAKDQAQEEYDYKCTLREQEHEALISQLQTERDVLDNALKEKLDRYDDDLTAFEALLSQEIEDMTAFVLEYNRLLDQLQDKTITVREIASEIAPEAATPYEAAKAEAEATGSMLAWSKARDYHVLPPEGAIWSPEYMQHGGIIHEPTLLTSLRTMRPYAIAGEKGKEFVTPSFPSITINIAEMNVRDARDIDLIAEQLVNRIRLRTGVRI